MLSRKADVSRAARRLLAVYLVPGCPGWDRARALAAHLESAALEHLEVQVIDLSRVETAPACVVASPTWVLDGRRLALGNPDAEWLLARLRELTRGD